MKNGHVSFGGRQEVIAANGGGPGDRLGDADPLGDEGGASGLSEARLLKAAGVASGADGLIPAGGLR